MEAMHPYFERSSLVRVIACAPVPRIAKSRVSLPRPFYSSSSYCQTLTTQTTTLTRRGNLNSNLDLTRSAIPCLFLNSHSVSLNLCAAIAMSAAPTRSIVHFQAPEGQRHCTLRGVRRVGTQERASRQSRKSTDRPSGSRTRRLDSLVGLERGRRAQPPQVWHIVPNIDQIFDIEEKPSTSLYPDIAPISCTTSKILPSVSLYPDTAIRYRTRYRIKTSMSNKHRVYKGGRN